MFVLPHLNECFVVIVPKKYGKNRSRFISFRRFPKHIAAVRFNRRYVHALSFLPLKRSFILNTQSRTIMFTMSACERRRLKMRR